MTANLIAEIWLGARAGEQAAAFGLCFAAGLVAGIVGLLYLRRSSASERILCDLFATLAIGAGALACCEFFLGGKPELYGVVAYALGASVLPLLVRKISRRKKRAKDGQKNAK